MATPLCFHITTHCNSHFQRAGIFCIDLLEILQSLENLEAADRNNVLRPMKIIKISKHNSNFIFGDKSLFTKNS